MAEIFALPAMSDELGALIDEIERKDKVVINDMVQERLYREGRGVPISGTLGVLVEAVREGLLWAQSKKTSDLSTRRSQRAQSLSVLCLAYQRRRLINGHQFEWTC